MSESGPSNAEGVAQDAAPGPKIRSGTVFLFVALLVVGGAFIRPGSPWDMGLRLNLLRAALLAAPLPLFWIGLRRWAPAGLTRSRALVVVALSVVADILWAGLIDAGFALALNGCLGC